MCTRKDIWRLLDSNRHRDSRDSKHLLFKYEIIPADRECKAYLDLEEDSEEPEVWEAEQGRVMCSAVIRA